MASPKQAVILVGGRGTRLGAAADGKPKPLVSVGGRPFLDRLLEDLARRGIEKTLLLCGHRAEQIVRHYADSSFSGMTVECIIEQHPLGTGGALLHAFDRLESTFLMRNGDTFFEADINKLGEHLSGSGIVCALVHRDDTSRYGAVNLEGDRVVSFAEKGRHGPGLINGGCYLIEKACLEPFCDGWAGTPVSFEYDILSRLVEERQVAGAVQEGVFVDIGLPDDLTLARRLLSQS